MLSVSFSKNRSIALYQNHGDVRSVSICGARPILAQAFQVHWNLDVPGDDQLGVVGIEEAPIDRGGSREETLLIVGGAATGGSGRLEDGEEFTSCKCGCRVHAAMEILVGKLV